MHTFDIETMPLPELEIAHLEPEFQAPSNFKDAQKISENIAGQRRAWIDRAALSPLTGKIAMIGVLSHEGELTILEGEESTMLSKFWQMFRDSVLPWSGFNIKYFDLPFMARRGFKYGIKVPIGARDGRYWSNDFCDVMESYQLGNNKDYISLDTLAKFLGVGEKSGNGKDFHKLPPDEQRKYLAHDLELTKLCAEKMIL